MVTISAVGDHSSKQEFTLYRIYYQLQSNRRFRKKGRILPALFKPMSWGVGFDLERVVSPLICPQAVRRDHPIIHLPNAAQVLPTDVGGFGSPFTVTGLIDYQDALRGGCRGRTSPEKLQALLIHLRRVPTGLRQEPLQFLSRGVLGAHGRFGGG